MLYIAHSAQTEYSTFHCPCVSRKGPSVYIKKRTIFHDKTKSRNICYLSSHTAAHNIKERTTPLLEEYISDHWRMYHTKVQPQQMISH